MARFKIILREGSRKETLKEYDEVDKVVESMTYKHPAVHFIKDAKYDKDYTLEEFIEKFRPQA